MVDLALPEMRVWIAIGMPIKRWPSKMSLRIGLFLETLFWLFTIALIAATLAAVFG
jgi:hypothetical protein